MTRFYCGEQPMDLRSKDDAVTVTRRSLTNADYRRIVGVTQYVAVIELRRLVEEGVLELRGERRGSRYVPGPQIDAR